MWLDERYRRERQARQAMFDQIDLYPVITASLSEAKDPVAILMELLKTPIKIVQLREKNLHQMDRFFIAEEFRKLIPENRKLLIVNDDVNSAISSGADGVHLGNTDMPVAEARKKNPDLLIGKSCTTLDEALRAETDGADYINVGPIFETSTKVGVKPVGLALISEIKNKIRIPMTVMGGITKDNLRLVLEAGATKVAMIKGLICGDIEKNVADCLEIFRSYRGV